jgi:PAS domain S-box-containing protein
VPLSDKSEIRLAEGTDTRLLRAVVECAADGIILIDARGSVLMFNAACEKLFQYSTSEVIGRNVKMLMPGPYRDEHDHYLDNFRRTGERKIIGIGREVFGQRKDGTTFRWTSRLAKPSRTRARSSSGSFMT